VALAELIVGSADLEGVGEALVADAVGDGEGEALVLTDGEGEADVGGADEFSALGDTEAALVEVSGTAARTSLGGAPSREGVS
jgi:hypothetical protein